MANVFAIKSGDWNDPTTWDNNLVPSSNDVVFANGYTINVNTDIDVNQLRSGSNYGQLVNMCVPEMTSNTSPSGVASASLNNALAYLAFDGNPSTYYDAGANSPFTLTYKFDTPKTIKRFRIVSVYQAAPNAFSVQASDDPAFGSPATIGGGSMPGGTYNTYISAVLTNSTPYLYYRLNVTTNILNGTTPRVYAFDLTESLSVITNGSGTALNTLLQTGGTYSTTALPTLPATRTVTVRNTTSGIANTSAGNVFQISATSGIININHSTLGNIVGGGSLVASQYNIYATPTAICTININGNLFGDTNGGASRNSGAFGIAGSITTTIIGNLTAGNSYNDGGNSWGSDAIVVLGSAGNSVINVTGNLLGQQVQIGGTPGSDAIMLQGSNATLNITGNVNSGLYYGVRTGTTYTGNINIVTGTVTATANFVGIYNPGTGIVTLFSPIINNTNTVGVLSQRIRFYQTGVSQWRFQDQTGANVTIYSGTGTSSDYPAEDTVRFGSPSYGPTLTEYNGTMRIPAVSNVNKGVEYGYGEIGTAVLTAEDFLNAISTSSNPVAVRLKNVSTVNTTGGQLAAFL